MSPSNGLVEPPKAAVRCVTRKGSGAHIKTWADLTSAQSHARRQDKKGKESQRPGADAADNYCWSLAGEGFEAGTNYVAAFKEHKRRHGITSDGNGALAMHLLVILSPGWLAETGDPRDWQGNPRVRQLIEEARRWAEAAFGKDCVWAVRYDADEDGAGNVDILCSPVRADGRAKARPKQKISINKALQELARRHGRQKSYSALQDSWAEHARRHLDACIVRGEESSKKPHLTPEEYKAKLAAEQELEAARLKHEEVQRILEAPPPTIPTIASPTFSERLAPDRWIAEQNSRLAEAAGQAAVRMAASDHERRRLAAELEQARTLSAAAEKISRERDLARMKADRLADDLKAEKAASARLKAERADTLRKSEAFAAEVREILEAPALNLVDEVAQELGLSPAGPFHIADDGRRFVLGAESWEEPSAGASGVGAISFVMQVLRARFEQALRWLTERFGLVRVQAEIATVAELDAPVPAGDAPRRPGL
ncbi:hypothetical protein [Xanthobacter flavus]|uniref:hypothetical protein n=1 Tax=Xanthobacter flavus TaxID=281 RepID=UPI001AE24DE7|nr:hypothetical protein [Xanthobacter flavus]